MMTRRVQVETLDGLAPDDPTAIRSRLDLQRVHRVMGSRFIVCGALKNVVVLGHGQTPLRVLELGAGDGSLMLGVAQMLAPAWPRVELTLLDAQALVTPATVAQYARLGWTAASKVVDVFDWAADLQAASPKRAAGSRWDLVVANLFLHHFEFGKLAGLLQTVARRTDCFFACEPRRSGLVLAASQVIGAIGVNAVTRNDAVLSVHAGFTGSELSAAWPEQGERWALQEYSAGLFSHCFRAQRTGMH